MHGYDEGYFQIMHRFFVHPACIDGERVSLEGGVARQISRVLRMSPGDEVVLLDNSGREYRVRLTSFNRDIVEGAVQCAREGEGETSISVTLYQGVLKGEKFEWVLQKGTELGVKTFVPLICRRSVPQGGDGWHISRYPRWQKIITEAAEQSGRCLLPQLRQPISFRDACKDACDGVQGSSMSIIPWEQEKAGSLRRALEDMRSPRANIFIGPEGGFEEDEASYARSCGVLPVSLGKRVLRSETAGIATVAAVLYEAGELGE